MINNKHKQASEHIGTYKKRIKPNSTDKAILRLVEFVEENCKNDETLRILDIGCGRGELVNALDGKGYSVTGIDPDLECVRITNSEKKLAIQTDGNNIDEKFREISFHIIIFSHSLEHFLNPLQIVEKAKKIGKFIIFAVPNPIRPFVIKKGILKRDYSNLGHLCCWDRSHFTVFLERRCNLKIVKWETDDVTFFQGLLGAGLRKVGFSILEETFFPSLFPYFSSSLIVLTEV